MTGEQAPSPPHNLQAEEHVLCAMMTSPAVIDTVRGILKPRDFYRTSHGHAFRAAVDLHSIGIGVDETTLAAELDSRNELTGEFTADHVRQIASIFATVSNAPFHAEIVAKMARFRELIYVGMQLGQMGWEAANIDQSTTRALELVAALEERGQREDLTVETWGEFEAQAHDEIPVLIDQLWPEGAFGFIAAPPKKGKTWVALAIAVAIATGRPLFGQFEIPQPRPVLYIALEGHRAGLRARVGAIARGMGVNPDPDSNELNNLHWLYKPRGINLADRSWAERIRKASDKPDASLLIVDVMRASARMKENDQEAFGALRANLQPITDDGRAIAMCHHNIKLSEISKERDPGERMSGSGAMYGALDAGIYITGSEDGARKLRIEFDLRDLATPNHINVHLTGEGTGRNAGYTYRDTATFQIVDQEVAEADLKAPPTEIVEWLNENGGQATSAEIRLAFDVDIKTISARETRLQELGVTVTRARGKATVYTVTEPRESPLPRDSLGQPDSLGQMRIHAGLPDTQGKEGNGAFPYPESGDLQDKQPRESRPSPTGSAYARARETLTASAENYALTQAWMEDSPAAAILDHYPTLETADLERIAQLAQQKAKDEMST